MKTFLKMKAFLLFVLASNLLMAGITGKIAGTITDKKTGEALVGANVVVSGTYLGTASDLEGRFVILSVPPGEYDLNISMIGYKKTTVSRVRVEIDLTTTIDVTLDVEVLEGEGVVVFAEKKIVKVDVAASQLSVTNKEIETLPFSSIGDVIGLKAGITSDLGIRGSGSDQTMLMLDGMVLRDDRNNSPIIGIPLSSVREVSVQTGGFNAEYNNVRSGLVNVVSKEGDIDKYSATITYKYSPPAPKHYGESVYGANSYWLHPFLWDSTAWNGTENGPWDEYDRRQFAPFDGWIAISEATLSDDNPDNDLTPEAARRIFEWQYRKDGNIHDPDTNVDFGFGGPIPGGQILGHLRFYYSRLENQSQYLFPLATKGVISNSNVLKLTSDLTDKMKLSLLTTWNGMSATGASRSGGTSYFTSIGGVADIVDRTGFTIPWRIFTSDYYSETRQNNRSLALSLSHILNSQSFYEIRLQNITSEYLTGPGKSRDTETLTEIFPGYFIDEQPFGFMEEFMSSVDGGITLGGPISTSRDSSVIKSFVLNADYTNQMTPGNQVKTGFEFYSSNLKMRFGSMNKVLPEGNTWTEFDRNPYRINVYVQDKFEHRGLVAIMGLNSEYYNPNGNWFDYKPYETGFYYYDPDSIWSSKYAKKAKAQFRVNPRIAISHPITDVSKLYFNYGHFSQSATTEALYRIQRNSVGAISYLGDPRTKPAMTISYELGFDQAIRETYLFRLAAYYKDVTNEQDWTRYISSDGKINSYVMTNNLYEDIRGLEIELSKRIGTWFTGMVNYEYRVSTSGYFDLGRYYQNPSDQSDFARTNDYQSKPLPTPRFKGYVDLFTPSNFGPNILGQNLLGGWHFNFIGRWTSGYWFTYNPNNIRGIRYNMQWQDYVNLDLKISKTVVMNNLSVKVFADIFNVLNLKRFSASSFSDRYDYDYYMQSLHLPASIGDKLRYGNIPGSDHPGDVRKDGVTFVPIESVKNIENEANPSQRALYYNQSDETYYQFVGGAWEVVPGSTLKQVLDDKAYIDMPNQTYFTFLSPRDAFLGLNISYNF